MLVFALPIYWVLGAPVAELVSGERHSRFAIAFGCVISGFCAELALMTHTPGWAWLLAAGAGCGFMVWRKGLVPNAAQTRELLLCYAVAVAAASCSPFPVLGSWSGDWWSTFATGREVLSGTLSAEHLARPPLFGAAMLPLWLISNELASYQLFAAVASVAAAQACIELGERIAKRPLPLAAFSPLLLSAFFLHNTAAAWSKLLSAAMILFGWALLVGEEPRPRWRAAFCFGAAVAIHEGAIVWSIAALLLALPRRSVMSALKEGLRLAVAAAAIAGPFVFWTLARYGLAARIAANPAVSDRSSDGFLQKSSLVIASTFVGWSPLTVLHRWLSNPARFSGTVVGKEGYWLVTSAVTLLAATFALVILPWVVAGGRAGARSAWRALAGHEFALGLGVVVATLATGALSPFYSEDGCLQVAHAPLALLFFAVAAVAACELGRIRRFVVVTALLSTLPWLALNLGVTTLLVLSPSFEQRFRTGSEGDYQRVLAEGVHPLGLASFPWLLLASAAIALLAVRLKASARQRETVAPAP